jgi:hypothetical protein
LSVRYLGLKDADGNAYARNVFNRPTPKDLHLLLKAADLPMIPALADAVPALGIESLQKMGATFILCANALAAVGHARPPHEDDRRPRMAGRQ